MATRKDRTNLTVSGNLKTAMAAAGYNSATLPQPGRTFYDGSATERILCLEQPPGSNALRTITLSGGGTPVADFDFIDLDDATATRYFTIRELNDFLAGVPGFETFSTAGSGTTWTAIVRVSGVDYNGSGNSEPNALANAVRTMLNALAAFLRQQ